MKHMIFDYFDYLLSNNAGRLRTFLQKFSKVNFFWKMLPLKGDELVMSLRNGQKMRFTDFVLKRTCLEEHLNLGKSGFVSEKGHTDCKFQNIAIRALKGNVLC